MPRITRLLHDRGVVFALTAATALAVAGPASARTALEHSGAAQHTARAYVGSVLTDVRAPAPGSAANTGAQPSAQVGARDAARQAAGWTVPPISHVSPTGEVTKSSRFDWGDAGIGAGGALALILVLGAGAFAVTRRRGAVGQQSALSS
jgi:hypothetical protein